MKASYLIVAFFLSLSIALQSQTVDSIKVEQAGDFIKIRYKILNSTPDQVYRVKVLCSINGGMNTEIRSISGDVGDMVAGGKPEYWVVWDVLKDVEELKSVEFIIRAELIKDLSETGKSKDINLSKRRFHLLLAADFPGPKAGLRVGYMGSWGFSAAFLYGKTSKNSHENEFIDVPHPNVPYWDMDLTKRFVNKENFKMHFMAGLSSAKLVVRNWTIEHFFVDPFMGFNFGFILDIKKWTASVGVSYFDDAELEKNSTDDNSLFSSSTYVNAGFGIRF